MKIVLAPNAFKECLSAPQVAQAMSEGIARVSSHIEAVQVPLADGGDGTMEALVTARGGKTVEIEVSDPLMRPVKAQYGLIDDGKTAVIEMAKASGLWMLADHEKNPLKTTTYGTGQLIKHSIESGVQSIIVGIGGSATTDAGIGMAAALGYRFFDDTGNELPPIGASMNRVARIDSSKVHPQLDKVSIFVASDVTNPLLGPEGAAPVYGPQKGATREMVSILEDGLANINGLWKRDLRAVIDDMPGGGAAGGLGAGLVAFCRARLRSGFDLIADYARLDEALAGASLVITGEGKVDASTRFGKVPAGVLRRAKPLGVPVIVIAGHIAGEVKKLNDEGIMALFSIVPGPVRLEEALKNASGYISQTVEQIVRVWRGKV